MRTSAPAGTAPGRGSQHALLDYLIRSQQQRLRDRQAERLSCLDVDAQPERHRSPVWKIVRHRTLEDAIDVGRRALKAIEQVISVEQQPARIDEITKRIERGHTVT